jgi:hypothetical protein
MRRRTHAQFTAVTFAQRTRMLQQRLCLREQRTARGQQLRTFRCQPETPANLIE